MNLGQALGNNAKMSKALELYIYSHWCVSLSVYVRICVYLYICVYIRTHKHVYTQWYNLEPALWSKGKMSKALERYIYTDSCVFITLCVKIYNYIYICKYIHTHKYVCINTTVLILNKRSGTRPKCLRRSNVPQLRRVWKKRSKISVTNKYIVYYNNHIHFSYFSHMFIYR